MVKNRASRGIKCPWCNSKIFKQSFVKHADLSHQIKEPEAIKLYNSRKQEPFEKGTHHRPAVIPMAPGEYPNAVYALRIAALPELSKELSAMTKDELKAYIQERELSA